MSKRATLFKGHKRDGRRKTALKQSEVIRSDNIHRINAVVHTASSRRQTHRSTETAAIANRFLKDKSVEAIDPDGRH